MKLIATLAVVVATSMASAACPNNSIKSKNSLPSNSSADERDWNDSSTWVGGIVPSGQNVRVCIRTTVVVKANQNFTVKTVQIGDEFQPDGELRVDGVLNTTKVLAKGGTVKVRGVLNASELVKLQDACADHSRLYVENGGVLNINPDNNCPNNPRFVSLDNSQTNVLDKSTGLVGGQLNINGEMIIRNSGNANNGNYSFKAHSDSTVFVDGKVTFKNQANIINHTNICGDFSSTQDYTIAGFDVALVGRDPQTSSVESVFKAAPTTESSGTGYILNSFQNGPLAVYPFQVSDNDTEIVTQCSGPAFPVEWGAFSVEQNEDDLPEIKFSVESEQNNNYFEIRRVKLNGLRQVESFVPVQTVKSRGDSTTTVEYTGIVDQKPDYFGTNIYQIVQVDFDGSSSHSGFVELTLDTSNIFKLNSANPAASGSAFSFKIKPKTFVSYRVFDMQGNQLDFKVIDLNTNQVDVQNSFSSGMYSVQFMTNDGQIFREKLQVL